MFDSSILLLFFGSSVVLGLAPGPDNLFVLTQSALHGRLAGLFVTVGLCTGLIVHTTIVAVGVAALFQNSAIAFTALKIAGAGYLIYLAYRAFRATAQHNGAGRQGLPPFRLYVRGIIMNITNPKVSIFFLAFLPQFADPARGNLVVQIFVLGLVFIVATVLVFGSISLLAGTLGQWLSKSGIALRVLNALAGIVFIGLAVRLIAETR
ncbi:MAG: Homoserine/homoserine lactone efflux protein [Gammaproteobacteria bacterium]|nr:Homoserine/homoserine lactone efflux protein [Gammaproteobacteria bacterium]